MTPTQRAAMEQALEALGALTAKGRVPPTGLVFSKAQASAASLRAALAEQPAELEPWYPGHPPFPQDQEWFIAETVYGDRVCLRSLDEGREHKGSYAFTTADGTYLKAEVVRRWMQFPDCEYLPPSAPEAPQPAKRVPLTEEEIDILYGEHCGDGGPTAICQQFARAVLSAYERKNGFTGETE